MALASLVAAGAGRLPNSGTDADPTQYVFSNNWAAVVGMLICAALLVAWCVEKAREPIEEEE